MFVIAMVFVKLQDPLDIPEFRLRGEGIWPQGQGGAIPDQCRATLCDKVGYYFKLGIGSLSRQQPDCRVMMKKGRERKREVRARNEKGW